MTRTESWYSRAAVYTEEGISITVVGYERFATRDEVLDDIRLFSRTEDLVPLDRVVKITAEIDEPGV